MSLVCHLDWLIWGHIYEVFHRFTDLQSFQFSHCARTLLVVTDRNPIQTKILKRGVRFFFGSDHSTGMNLLTYFWHGEVLPAVTCQQRERFSFPILPVKLSELGFTECDLDHIPISDGTPTAKERNHIPVPLGRGWGTSPNPETGDTGDSLKDAERLLSEEEETCWVSESQKMSTTSHKVQNTLIRKPPNLEIFTRALEGNTKLRPVLWGKPSNFRKY